MYYYMTGSFFIAMFVVYFVTYLTNSPNVRLTKSWNPYTAIWGPKYEFSDLVDEDILLIEFHQFPDDEYMILFNVWTTFAERSFAPKFAKRKRVLYHYVTWTTDGAKRVPTSNLLSRTSGPSQGSFNVDDPVDWRYQADFEFTQRIQNERNVYGFDPNKIGQDPFKDLARSFEVLGEAGNIAGESFKKFYDGFGDEIMTSPPANEQIKGMYTPTEVAEIVKEENENG